MKLEFLKKEEDNTRLILVFAGWSTGPEIARGIDMPGWDVAVAYDFSSLSLDTCFLSSYYTVYLFAWSLGVYAASLTLPAHRITSAFAINGTLHPVDDELGIPDAIFRGTAENLSVRNLLKFRMRMMRDTAQWKECSRLFDCEPDDGRIEHLRNELINILVSASSSGNEATQKPSLQWTRAYISTGDRIFPPANMRKAWNLDPDVEQTESAGGHYTDIAEIVRNVISDPRKVSEKFARAASTYDTHAIAQYSIALKLASKFEEICVGSISDLLEIGCGTGLFTREYSRWLRPRRATFVDITRTGPFCIADEEKYVTEDAEKWIAAEKGAYDAIVSASCIQWFADIPRFLHECSEHLRPGGVLALSTFLPGNMGELDEVRPTPLLYPKKNQLIEWLEHDFTDIEVTDEEIKVEFKSVREMLMHLKHTGVGGSAPSSGRSMSDLAHLKSLTYRPVYITARKI